MSTYIHLEIVSTLQRSKTTFIKGVKDRKALNLPLENGKSIIMNIFIDRFNMSYVLYFWRESDKNTYLNFADHL